MRGMVEREPLNPRRIVEAAARVADRGGLDAVSMRNVGAELGVEAMSLYHHVANKEALLDALADEIFVRIELPREGEPWRAAMSRRCASARHVLSRHPWALRLIESRPPGEALLRHHDRVLGCLRGGGFDVATATHAFSVLDAYVYGFALTEQNVPIAPDEAVDESQVKPPVTVHTHPHLTEMYEQLVVSGDFVFADEFAYGLDLILDQLEVRLTRR